jgi:carboxymethylenebutenolidase
MTEQDKIDLFEKHVGAELAGDLDTTMATMSDNPHAGDIPCLSSTC